MQLYGRLCPPLPVLNLLHIKPTATPIPAPSGLPWQLSFLRLRFWDHLYHIRQIFSPCPVQSPQSHDQLCPQSSPLFPRADFSPAQVAKATLGQVAVWLLSPAAIWSMSILTPIPSSCSVLPGESWGSQALCPRDGAPGVRAEAELATAVAHVSASIFIWEAKSARGAMRRPQGPRCLPQLEPDTICTTCLSLSARPPGGGQHLLGHRDILPAPLPSPPCGAAGAKELGTGATSSGHGSTG